MIDNTYVMDSILEKFNNDFEPLTRQSKRIAQDEGYIKSFLEKLSELLKADHKTCKQIEDFKNTITDLQTAYQEYAYIKGIEDGINLLSFFSRNQAIANTQKVLNDTASSFDLNELRNHSKID